MKPKEITDKEQKVYERVRDFIKKHYPHIFKNLQIDVVSDREMKPYIACIMSNKNKSRLFLELSRKSLTLKDHEVMGILLHEMGHLEARGGRYGKKGDDWKCEYQAQTWAMQEAKKLKMNKVFSYLFFEMFVWSQNFIKVIKCNPPEMIKYVKASWAFAQQMDELCPKVTLTDWKK